MSHHDPMPEDIRHTAARLAALGEHERAAGAVVADRVAMRTTHLLRERSASPRLPERLRRAWWLALPVCAAAALLLALSLLRPAPRPAPGSPEVLAAALEQDIDALLEMDAMWRRDSFEDSLALLSLDTADIAGRADDLGSLPALESDL